MPVNLDRQTIKTLGNEGFSRETESWQLAQGLCEVFMECYLG